MKRTISLLLCTLLAVSTSVEGKTYKATKLAVWNRKFTVLEWEKPRKINQGWLRLRYAAPMLKLRVPPGEKLKPVGAALQLHLSHVEIHPKPKNEAERTAVNTRLEIYRMLVDWDESSGLKHEISDQPVAGLHYEAKPFAVKPLPNTIKNGDRLRIEGFDEPLANWASGKWPNYGFIMKLVQTGTPPVIQINFGALNHKFPAAVATGKSVRSDPGTSAGSGGIPAEELRVFDEIKLLDRARRPIAVHRTGDGRYVYGDGEHVTVTRRSGQEEQIVHLAFPDNRSVRYVGFVLPSESAARVRPPVVSIYSEKRLGNQRHTAVLAFEGGTVARLGGRSGDKAAVVSYILPAPGKGTMFMAKLANEPGEVLAHVVWGARAKVLRADSDDVNLREELAFTGGAGASVLLHRIRKYVFTAGRAQVTPEVVNVSQSKTLHAKWRIIDEAGTIVRTGSFDVKPPTSGLLAPIRFRCNLNGVWRFALDVLLDGKAVQKREALIAVLPQHGYAGVEGMRFGFCRHSWQRHDNRYLNQLSKDIGAGWFRIWLRVFIDPKLEGGEVRMALNKRATEVLKRVHEEQGMKVLGIVGPLLFSKNWQKDITNRLIKLRKTDVADYKRHYEKMLMTLVPALAPYVDVWETMNEPYFQHQDEVPLYMELSAMTKRIVDKYDPGARIVGICGPPGANGFKWYAQLIEAGDLANQDIVSHHPYTTNYGTEYLPAAWSRAIRALIAAKGGKHPLWNTEYGLHPVTFYSLPAYQYGLEAKRFKSMTLPARACAAMLVKQSIANFAGGTEKNFIFTHTGMRHQSLDQIEFDGTPKHASVGYAMLAKVLRRRSFVRELQPEKTADFKAPAFAGRDGAVIAMLAVGYRPGESVVVSAPKGKWKYCDTYGNPIAAPADGTIALSEDVIYAITDDPSQLASAGVLRVLQRRRKTENAPDAEVRDDTKPADWHNRVAVDLAPYTSRSFTDTHPADGLGGWSDEGDNDMRFLPVGKLKLAGVPFVVIDPKTNNGTSCIVMKSAGAYPAPERVRIPLGNKVRKLHFLHTSTFTADKVVAEIVIHYAEGGRKLTIPIRSKFEINDWYAREKPELAEIAWRGKNPHTSAVSLFKFTWENPHPANPIEAIEIVSRKSASRYIMVAITADLGF